MITIEPVSAAIGAGVILLLWIVSQVLIRLKKPKHDLHNIKKLVQESGDDTRKVYERLQELGKVFKEMEKQ